ncbi:hypothetical protein [Enterovirga sp.]|jgi:hypothetical protein|uniref:hypothetical protein n=1 Tax=Enterovirga sp. TaxID=2026350 RepID=UPI0026161B43|nr:hypothetical protein [Enterovirga sp.]MDB5592139.1 hypothetical protein [Enterovirga sp.]
MVTPRSAPSVPPSSAALLSRAVQRPSLLRMSAGVRLVGAAFGICLAWSAIALGFA